MDEILIGLVAPKQSGKDTAANYLCTAYGFKKYNFADPLKIAIGNIFGFSYEQLHGKEKESIDPFWEVSPRELFQKIGTELFQYHLPNEIEEFKKFGRSFWVKCFEKWYLDRKNDYISAKTHWSSGAFENMLKDLPSNIFDTTKPNFRVIVSDVRFVHEANKIKKMGGILIKIDRDNQKNIYSDHSSEIELDEILCDHVVKNDGDLLELYEQFDNIVKNLIYRDI